MAENYFGLTDTGKMRSNNEDTYIAETVEKGKLIVACVIDGVGGYEGGEVASNLARLAIAEHLSTANDDKIQLVKEAFIVANNRVYNERQFSKENSHMACVASLALVDIANNVFYYAHVGDTRLYLYRDNTLVKISHDHSFVGFLEDNGRLTEAEAMNHPKRNEINKALGFNDTIDADEYIETGESPFLPNDILLLCSDGLSDLVDRKTMIDILAGSDSLSNKSSLLIEMANNAGGKDNITVVLVKNNKEAAIHTATKPVVTNNQMERNTKKETITSEYKAPQTSVPLKPNKTSGAVPVLTVLLLLLLAAFVWLFYVYIQNKNNPQVAQNVIADSSTKRNEKERNLADSINSAYSNEVFLLNTAGDQSWVITDTLNVGKDSLHIIGNGASFVSSEMFKGPAFVIAPSVKYLLLDSMTFENFDVALLLQNNSVHFKDVYFKNCRVPVQHNLFFNYENPLNGVLSDTIITKTGIMR